MHNSHNMKKCTALCNIIDWASYDYGRTSGKETLYSLQKVDNARKKSVISYRSHWYVLCHEYFGLWFLLVSTLADQTPNWFSLTIPPFSLWCGTWPSLLNHTVFGTWCLNPWVKLGVFGAPIVKETLAKPGNSWAFSEKLTLCQNFLQWLGVLDIWTLLSTV